jgi:hypothetical protein
VQRVLENPKSKSAASISNKAPQTPAQNVRATLLPTQKCKGIEKPKTPNRTHSKTTTSTLSKGVASETSVAGPSISDTTSHPGALHQVPEVQRNSNATVTSVISNLDGAISRLAAAVSTPVSPIVKRQFYESQPYERAEGSLLLAAPVFLQYLTIEEQLQIGQQFHDTWRRNNQVLWSGMLREDAQRWADAHDMETLTTAMGPLMTPNHPQCLRTRKSEKGWSKYMKGASAVFAWYISRGEKATVLTPPPPERFHPSGLTNYQAIEEPILKGRKESGDMLRIEMVHPTVEGAENFSYQIWPVDETSTWLAKFGTLARRKQRWRMVKAIPENVGMGGTTISTAKRGVSEEAVPSNEERASRENVATVRKKAKSTEGKQVRDAIMITGTESVANSGKHSGSSEARKTQKAPAGGMEAKKARQLEEEKMLKEKVSKKKKSKEKKASKETPGAATLPIRAILTRSGRSELRHLILL